MTFGKKEKMKDVRFLYLEVNHIENRNPVVKLNILNEVKEINVIMI